MKKSQNGTPEDIGEKTLEKSGTPKNLKKSIPQKIAENFKSNSEKIKEGKKYDI